MGTPTLAPTPRKYLIGATHGDHGTDDMKVVVGTVVLAVLATTVLLLEYLGSLGAGVKP